MKPLHLQVALTAINHITYNGARLTVLLYAVHLGASPVEVGLMTALFAVVAIATSVITGRWVDRIGPRRPMLYASLMMSAGAATAFFWDALPALYVTSLVVGSFFDIYFIGNQTQLARLGNPEDRVGNYSMQMQGFSLSGLASPLLIGLSVDAFGHARTFLLLAALPLVTALALWLNRGLGFAQGSGARARPAAAAGSVWGLLRMPDLRRIFIVALLFNIAWNLYNFLTPIYGLHIALSASSIGMILSMLSLGSLVVRTVVPALARRYAPWQVLLVALLTMTAGLIASPLLHGATALMVVAFWMGLSLGVGGPMSMALIHDASPPDRFGEVLGLRLSLINTMQTSVPLLAGAIGAAVGIGPVFWALAALMIAGAYMARRQWHAPRA